jgi:hypothetical protein
LYKFDTFCDIFNCILDALEAVYVQSRKFQNRHTLFVLFSLFYITLNLSKLKCLNEQFPFVNFSHIFCFSSFLFIIHLKFNCDLMWNIWDFPHKKYLLLHTTNNSDSLQQFSNNKSNQRNLFVSENFHFIIFPSQFFSFTLLLLFFINFQTKNFNFICSTTPKMLSTWTVYFNSPAFRTLMRSRLIKVSRGLQLNKSEDFISKLTRNSPECCRSVVCRVNIKHKFVWACIMMENG